MTRLLRRLLWWWPRYRVAPRLANPAYLAIVHLAELNMPKWGLTPNKDIYPRVTLWDERGRR